MRHKDRLSARKETPMYRVKLYKLNSQGHWDDKGTGHVAVEFLPVRNSSPRACARLRPDCDSRANAGRCHTHMVLFNATRVIVLYIAL
jgi:hypothetical protein